MDGLYLKTVMGWKFEQTVFGLINGAKLVTIENPVYPFCFLLNSNFKILSKSICRFVKGCPIGSGIVLPL
jgi:hypothetical protein